MGKNVTYKQEFFDREYTAKEAYGRLWSFAKKYKFRLVMGVLCGMLTAGTLVPMFSLIQPALAKVEQRDQGSGIGDQGSGIRDQGSGGDIQGISSFRFCFESLRRRQADEESSQGIR